MKQLYKSRIISPRFATTNFEGLARISLKFWTICTLKIQLSLKICSTLPTARKLNTRKLNTENSTQENSTQENSTQKTQHKKTQHKKTQHKKTQHRKLNTF